MAVKILTNLMAAKHPQNVAVQTTQFTKFIKSLDLVNSYLFFKDYLCQILCNFETKNYV